MDFEKDYEAGSTDFPQEDRVTLTWKPEIDTHPNFQISQMPKSGETLLALSTKPGSYKGMVMGREETLALYKLLGMYLEATREDGEEEMVVSVQGAIGPGENLGGC